MSIRDEAKRRAAEAAIEKRDREEFECEREWARRKAAAVEFTKKRLGVKTTESQWHERTERSHVWNGRYTMVPRREEKVTEYVETTIDDLLFRCHEWRNYSHFGPSNVYHYTLQVYLGGQWRATTSLEHLGQLLVKYDG